MEKWVSIHSYTNVDQADLKFSKGTAVLVPRVGEDHYNPKINLLPKIQRSDYIKLDEKILYSHIPLDDTISKEDAEKLLIEVGIRELHEAVASVVD